MSTKPRWGVCSQCGEALTEFSGNFNLHAKESPTHVVVWDEPKLSLSERVTALEGRMKILEEKLHV